MSKSGTRSAGADPASLPVVSAMARRILALVFAFAIGLVSAGAGFVGIVWGFGLKCDDSCGEPPPWRDDQDAWQWSALGWTGVAAAVPK